MSQTLAEIQLSKNLGNARDSFNSNCDQFYQTLFENYKNRAVQIIEIGTTEGNGIQVLANYFQNGQILGIGNQLDSRAQANCAKYQNIQLSMGNAYMFESLQYFPKADIIINFGPNNADTNIWAVKNLSTRVNPGGMFIIENVQNRKELAELQNVTPFHLKDHIQLIEQSVARGRLGGSIFIIKVPNQHNISVSPSSNTGMDLLYNPVGAEMVGMSERLKHLQGIIDFGSVRSIIDVGSNGGYEAVNMARVFTNAHVYGFEPTLSDYNNCVALANTMTDDVKSRVHFYNLALNNIDGSINFYPLDENLARSNNKGLASKFKIIDEKFLPWELNVQKTVTVDAISLNTWCSQNNVYPDILWMDAQGAELDILKGGDKFLNSVKAILTEVCLKPIYHDQAMKNDIDMYLADKGFRELVSGRKLGHEWEMDTIYIRTS
jgi:FkbM family methyltransferase